MRSDEASQTAIISAAFRAAHACVFEGPVIHDDQYALQFLEVDDAEQLRKGFEASNTPALPEASAYFALRHRFSEELLFSAVERGVRQIILLGAGLDSFALRNPDVVSKLDFFEVDHPNTQRWKLERMEALGLGKSDIRYLSIDFDSQDLKEALVAEGVDFNQRIFFSWLGVTQYISREAANQTLRLVTGARAGSEVVFDIIVAPEELDEAARFINATYAAASESRGEPWITTYSPDALTEELRSIGFGSVQRLTPEEAGRRYYAGQPANVVPMQGWQLIHATV
jgi:methyltransferase (TIGR00027 family)